MRFTSETLFIQASQGLLLPYQKDKKKEDLNKVGHHLSNVNTTLVSVHIFYSRSRVFCPDCLFLESWWQNVTLSDKPSIPTLRSFPFQEQRSAYMYVWSLLDRAWHPCTHRQPHIWKEFTACQWGCPVR